MLIVSVALFYTFTSPQWDQVANLRAQEQEHAQTLRDAAAIMELRDNLMATYRSFPEADIERIKRILPDEADLVQLAYEMDVLASQHGIAVDSVSASNASDDGASSIEISESSAPVHQKATVTFGFLANYPSFSPLLADLEKSLRIMDVRSVSFVVNEAGLYDHTVTVDTYWLK